MSKEPTEHPKGDPYFLQRILLAVIEAYPHHTDSPLVRLRTAMEALFGGNRTEVNVPWPLPDEEYYEAVVQLRLTEMREKMTKELPADRQVGIMSLAPKKMSRNKRMAKAVDQFQENSKLKDPENALKDGLEEQPTRPFVDYVDLHEVLRLLRNHGIKTGKQK